MPSSGITLWFGPTAFTRAAGAAFHGNNSSYLSHTSNATLNLNATDFTILIWVKAGTLSNSGNIFRNLIGKNIQGTNQASWGIYRNRDNGAGTDRYNFQISKDGTLGSAGFREFTSLGNVSSNGVYLLMVRYTYSTTVGQVEVSGNDGTKDTLSYNNGAFACTAPFEIGRFENTNPTNDDIQNVLITKNKLTDADITWYYNSGNGRDFYDISVNRPALLSSVVGYWDCSDAGSASSAIDQSANHLHLSRNSTPAVVAGFAQDGVSSWTDGGSAAANATGAAGVNYATIRDYNSNNQRTLTFDGVNTLLTFTLQNLGTANHGFIVWQWHGGTNSGVVVGNTQTPEEQLLYVDATNMYYRPSGLSNVQVAHGGLTVDTLYLLEVERNGTSVIFRVLGVQKGTTQTLSANSDLHVASIGGWTNGIGRGFISISEVRIWNRVLSTEERFSEYTYFDDTYGFTIVGKVTGAATLHGQGTLTAVTSTIIGGAATLHSGGTLTAVPSAITVTGAATLHGSGTLTATGGITRTASATLHGQGTLTAISHHVIPPLPDDAVIPLFTTLDYTLAGKVITFTNEGTTPVDTQQVLAYWAELLSDPEHTHHYLLRTDWPSTPPVTWTLPTLPIRGTLRVYLKQIVALHEYLWILQGPNSNDDTYSAWLRRARLDVDTAAFIDWDNAPIFGFLGAAGTDEHVDAIAVHDTDKEQVWIATHGAGLGSVIYKYDGVSLNVVDNRTLSGVCGQLFRDRATGKLYFCDTGSAVVYVSDTNGENFAAVSGTPAGVSHIHSVALNTAGDIYVEHELANPNSDHCVVSYSTDGGATWAHLLNTSHDQFSGGNPGSIGYDETNDTFGYSYWHFSVFVDAPEIVSGAPSGVWAAPLTTTNGTQGIWNGGQRLFLQYSTGTTYNAPSGVSWTLGPAGLGPLVQRGFSLHPSKAWAAIASYGHQYVNISTDYGVTFGEDQQIALTDYCKLVGFLGGKN